MFDEKKKRKLCPHVFLVVKSKVHLQFFSLSLTKELHHPAVFKSPPAIDHHNAKFQFRCCCLHASKLLI